MAYVRKVGKRDGTYELTQLAEVTTGSSLEEFQMKFEAALIKTNISAFNQGVKVIVSEDGQYIELVGVHRLPS